MKYLKAVTQVMLVSLVVLSALWFHYQGNAIPIVALIVLLTAAYGGSTRWLAAVEKLKQWLFQR